MIKATMTAEGCAAIFLRFRQGFEHATPDDVQALARLLTMVFDSGVTAAIEVALEEYRRLHTGGCRMFSEGNECQCFLCAMDRRRK